MLLRALSLGNHAVKKYAVIEWILMTGGKEPIWHSVTKLTGNFPENTHRSWLLNHRVLTVEKKRDSISRV